MSGGDPPDELLELKRARRLAAARTITTAYCCSGVCHYVSNVPGSERLSG